MLTWNSLYEVSVSNFSRDALETLANPKRIAVGCWINRDNDGCWFAIAAATARRLSMPDWMAEVMADQMHKDRLTAATAATLNIPIWQVIAGYQRWDSGSNEDRATLCERIREFLKAHPRRFGSRKEDRVHEEEPVAVG